MGNGVIYIDDINWHIRRLVGGPDRTTVYFVIKVTEIREDTDENGVKTIRREIDYRTVDHHTLRDICQQCYEGSIGDVKMKKITIKNVP